MSYFATQVAVFLYTPVRRQLLKGVHHACHWCTKGRREASCTPHDDAVMQTLAIEISIGGTESAVEDIVNEVSRDGSDMDGWPLTANGQARRDGEDGADQLHPKRGGGELVRIDLAVLKEHDDSRQARPAGRGADEDRHEYGNERGAESEHHKDPCHPPWPIRIKGDLDEVMTPLHDDSKTQRRDVLDTTHK